MKSLPLLILILITAACASSPTAPRIITFTGDYIDARKDETAKTHALYKKPLHVPVYLIERELDPSAVVAFMVETDGRTSEIQVVSTTDPEFAEAVCASLAGWRYEPLVKDGKTVRVVLQESFSVDMNRYRKPL